MLAKRATEDAIIQKLLCYATMILLLVYFMKFLKQMTRGRRSAEPQCTPEPACSAPCAHSSSKTSPPDAQKEDHKTCKKPRRRRHHRYMPEQWLPRNPPHRDLYD